MKYLVVIDMQNDFITGALGSAEAQKIVPRAAEKLRRHAGGLIYTMDTHGEEYLGTLEGKNLPVKHCLKGTEGWRLHPEVAPRGEENVHVFCKNGFGSADMADFFRRQNNLEHIEEIELIGLCTDVCVISNAMLLKSFLPDVPVAVDASCCAGVTPENHKTALEAMRLCQIEIHEPQLDG